MTPDGSDIGIGVSVGRYIDSRREDLSKSSLQNHEYQLKRWIEYCDGVGVQTLSDVDPFAVDMFRRDRAASVAGVTLYNCLVVLRLYLRYCARMDWIDDRIPKSIVMPSRDGSSRSTSISTERIEDILDYLSEYETGSVNHLTVALTWHCGFRIGSLRAIDVSDIYIDERYIQIRHRPKTGTPLKNGKDGERDVVLSAAFAGVIRSALDRYQRSADSHGRVPLMSTPLSDGRLNPSSIRKNIYTATDCAGPSTTCSCDSVCDRSVSPHDIRRSAITYWLRQGHDSELLSGRFDVSVDVMSEHYDVRSMADKRETRREQLGLD